MKILNLYRQMSNSLVPTLPLRYICFGLVMLVLIAGVIFAPKPNQMVLAQAQTPSTQLNEPPIKPQRVYLPHWSNEDGFVSTIFIRNVNIKHAVNAKLSLILKHRTITLTPINIPALQTIPVEVGQALITKGEHDNQEGGAYIDFEASSAGSVNAYAQVLDLTRSLSLSLPFMENVTEVPGSLEAVALFYSKKTDGYLALQNTTDTAVNVTPTAFYSNQTVNLGQQQIPPRQLVTIKLPIAPGATGNSPAFSVGLRVAYSGSAGSIVAQGWVVEKNIGFSVPFAFRTPGGCNCTGQTHHLYGAGVSIGAGAMMGMTPGSIFSPYLAVRNRSNNVLNVKPIFSYETPLGTRKVTLPTISLNPQTNTLVNLKTYQDQGLIAQNAGDGNIDLQYQGEAGALVADLTSVDQAGTFVSPVPLTCSGNRSLHQSYWRTDGDWHSMLTLQNIATEENDVELTISYPGGVYVVNKKLAAGATFMLDVNGLQHTQTPNASGHLIPLTAKNGGINVWSRNQNAGLVMNAMLMNPTTKTCGSCNGTGYVNWWYLSDFYGSPYSGFDTHFVGDSIPIYMHMHWTTSNYSTDFPTLQSTSNSTVVNSSLNAVGIGGSTLTTLTGGNYPTDVVCSSVRRLSASGSVQVYPLLTVAEVGFNSDHELRTWNNNTALQHDIDKPDGTEPTWKSSSNPDYPVAYTKAISPTLFAKLSVLPVPTSSLTVDIRVKQGGTVVATINGVDVSTGSVTLTNVALSQTLSDKIKTESFSYTWEFSFDSAFTWKSAGDSGPHKIYTIAGTPQSNPFQSFKDGTSYAPLYDLALEKGCSYINGTTGVIDATALAKLALGTSTGSAIQYNPASLLDGHPLGAYTTPCLCADYAELLRGLVRSLGGDGPVVYMWAGNNNTTFRGYDTTAAGTSCNSSASSPFCVTFRVTRPSKDSAPTNPHFSYHAGVSFNSVIYDAVYGDSYASPSFTETAQNSTSVQTSTTFPSLLNFSGWTCSH